MLKDYSSTIIDEIINAIQTYTETTTREKWLVCPLSVISNKDIPKENCAEVRFPCPVVVLVYFNPMISSLTLS